MYIVLLLLLAYSVYFFDMYVSHILINHNPWNAYNLSEFCRKEMFVYSLTFIVVIESNIKENFHIVSSCNKMLNIK
jgi:hypothetical protein